MNLSLDEIVVPVNLRQCHIGEKYIKFKSIYSYLQSSLFHFTEEGRPNTKIIFYFTAEDCLDGNVFQYIHIINYIDTNKVHESFPCSPTYHDNVIYRHHK